MFAGQHDRAQLLMALPLEDLDELSKNVNLPDILGVVGMTAMCGAGPVAKALAKYSIK
jgi:hypothetical protein